jgi:hypothetical protein
VTLSPDARRRLRVAAIFVLLVRAVPADTPEYPHGAFQDDCSLCHRPDSWSPVNISPEFDHGARGFPLLDSHARADCRSCHTTLEFKVAASDCASCHLDPHQGELGIDCGRCHTPRSFIDRASMIRGHLSTRLPLDGRHRTIDCEDCHVPVPQGTLQFVGLPADCFHCHSDDFTVATDPNHQAPGFSQQCEQCHTTRAWEPATFNHNQLPAGAQCVDCHLADFVGTTDPDHEVAGFPQQCEQCHSTNAWQPAAFDHDLLPPGAACVSCHLDDYQATSNPNHAAAGFPQQCDDCHGTNAWQPASFDHDSVFPIYSGRHQGEWTECTDCHVVPSNFAVFSCIDCHEHDNPSELQNDHDEVSGYVYNSAACYSCHPNGN